MSCSHAIYEVTPYALLSASVYCLTAFQLFQASQPHFFDLEDGEAVLALHRLDFALSSLRLLFEPQGLALHAHDDRSTNEQPLVEVAELAFGDVRDEMRSHDDASLFGNTRCCRARLGHDGAISREQS